MYLEEEENDVTVVDLNNCILSGPNGPNRGRKIVIPKDPSKYNDFPRVLGQFKSRKEFESEVLRYWRRRQNQQKNAKRKAERQATQFTNDKVVGRSGTGSYNGAATEQVAPQQSKRFIQESVSKDALPFAVYVEKFDSSHRVKLQQPEWEEIRIGIFNAFILESPDTMNKLKDACERRVYNGEYVIFFIRNAFAQNFVIDTIKEKLKLPGIKARGPRDPTESRPNFHVEFPSALNRMQPETVLQKAISLHIDIQLNSESVKIRNIKMNRQTGGRSLACELPNDVLEKVQNWAIDKKARHFSLFTERLRFWTVKSN